MAITKILHQKVSPGRELGLHTKQLIDYIFNPDKTEQCILTGSVNCLPDTAYEQMVETKKVFGKLGGRQSYHIIISLVPGEGTPEELYEMTEKFVAEFLHGEYEVVFAVHTDHEHLHSHIVFNSVNMVTGRKFQYKNGDWKHKMQPITNKLSEEYGLEIMPAEYSKDPKNVSRDQWEKEKSFSEFIEADARYCMMRAENREHYIYLLKELGYEVKDGEHIAVKASGMKRFKRLGTIAPELDYRNIEQKDNKEKGRTDRLYKTIDPRPLRRALLSPLQKKYYVRLYKMRLLEKRRFQYKSAQFYKDLQRFKLLQEEYLFLVSEDIRSVDDLINVKVSALHRYREISEEQKCLYKEKARLRNKKNKNAISQGNVDSFDEDEYRDRLQILKELKREEDKRFRIADKIYQDCLYDIELKDIDSISISEFEKELDNVDTEEKIPELPKPKPESVIESVSKTKAVESEAEHSRKVEIDNTTKTVKNIVTIEYTDEEIAQIAEMFKIMYEYNYANKKEISKVANEPNVRQEEVPTFNDSKVIEDEVLNKSTVDESIKNTMEEDTNKEDESKDVSTEQVSDISIGLLEEESPLEYEQPDDASHSEKIESDYEIEIIAIDAVIDIKNINLSVQDFFLLSVEDKAAIWDVTKYDPLDAFEAYRKVADSAQVNKSVPDLYDEFIRIKNKCLEYKKEPWEREYRKIVLKGEYNNDKKLVRTKVR